MTSKKHNENSISSSELSYYINIISLFRITMTAPTPAKQARFISQSAHILISLKRGISGIDRKFNVAEGREAAALVMYARWQPIN
jgi:hypothetical protein